MTVKGRALRYVATPHGTAVSVIKQAFSGGSVLFKSQQFTEYQRLIARKKTVYTCLVKLSSKMSDQKDYQGGKAYGKLRETQEKDIDAINELYLEDADRDDEYPDLAERLQAYKRQFMEFDEDNSGDIDIMELKRMMEKLGQAKTHLELKKMIGEVDTRNAGTIDYKDFLSMMLGKKSSVLKLILMFEEKRKGKERPTGPAPKRDLSSLP